MRAKMFHFQTKVGRLFGAYSLFITSVLGASKWAFWMKHCLLLKSSSPRTPRLIMPCMLCHSTHSKPPPWWWWTVGEWSAPPLPPPPLPSWNVLVWPKCAFSVLGYCRELLSMWTYQLGSAIKITSQILWKLEYDILKTHWGKHTGCWFSHHSSQFLSLSSNYSEETPCLDHLTRSSSHRTSRFIMPCLFMQLNT